MGKHLIRLINAVEQGPSLSYGRLPGQMKGTSGVQRTLDMSLVHWITSPSSQIYKSVLLHKLGIAH